MQSDSYSEICRQFARPAAKIQVISQYEFDSVDWHFGLAPFATAADVWPICKSCKHAMAFICQAGSDVADRASPGQENKSSELIVLYACGRCFDLGLQKEGVWAVLQYAAPSSTQYVPLEPRPKVKASAVYQWLAVVANQAVPFKITLGEKFLCMPMPDHLDLLAKRLRGGDGKKILDGIDLSDDSYKDHMIATGYCLPEGSSQLGGYPIWDQGPESIACRQCKREMDLYLQISCQDCWIGADGNALLFRCKEHIDRFQLFVTST